MRSHVYLCSSRWSADAVTHSCSALSQLVNVCIHWSACRSVQSMFHCLLCLNQCALACASTASMFASISSNRTVCQQKKKRLHQRKTRAARQWNLRQHPSFALLVRFEAPWRSQVLLLPCASFSTVMVKKVSVPIMANLEPLFLRSVNECGAEFCWKYMYSQDTALQEIPRQNSVFTSELVSRLSKLPVAALRDWPLRSRIREQYMRQCWCWGS